METTYASKRELMQWTNRLLSLQISSLNEVRPSRSAARFGVHQRCYVRVPCFQGSGREGKQSHRHAGTQHGWPGSCAFHASHGARGACCLAPCCWHSSGHILGEHAATRAFIA